MALATLPISRLINVDVVLTPQAAQAQDLSTLLVLGNSDVIDVTQRLRTYTSIASVAADFGTSAPEYLAASAYFSQSPQPRQIKIGRWAKTATKGTLVSGALSAAEQAIASWNAITTGAFTIAVDGAGPTTVSALNFSGSSNLNGVAAVIDAAWAGGTVIWDSVNSVFRFQATTTGATSSLDYLGTPGAGVDISATLKARSTSSGAYVANGVAAEAPAAAAALFDLNFGQTWYALTMPEIASNSDHVTVAAYIEAANNKHIYGMTTQEAGAISASSTTDLAYLISQLLYKRSVVQYSSTSAYAIASLLGRILTVDYNGNNTVIDLMYKQEPGITGEALTETQMNALQAKHGNVFVKYNNDTVIIQPGDASSGDPLDIITGTDWLAVTIMTAVYNLLYTSPTKIPQTDTGVHRIVTTVDGVCSQAVVNGLLAPGVWSSDGFGTLNPGDYLPAGFYVYAPKVSSQLQADREARRSPTIQIAAKLAGAVRTVDIIINVNR